MTHKFKLHQHVQMTQWAARDTQHARAVVWEVVRLMPADATGELFYRVRCDGVERAASEASLRAA